MALINIAVMEMKFHNPRVKWRKNLTQLDQGLFLHMLGKSCYKRYEVVLRAGYLIFDTPAPKPTKPKTIQSLTHKKKPACKNECHLEGCSGWKASMLLARQLICVFSPQKKKLQGTNKSCNTSFPTSAKSAT